MSYNYLENNYNITENQFKNILAFLFVMGNESSRFILEHSPDYILDKYSRYIGDPESVNIAQNHLWGLHPILNDIMEEYHNKWGYPINWKLKPLLKNV